MGSMIGNCRFYDIIGTHMYDLKLTYLCLYCKACSADDAGMFDVVILFVFLLDH